MTKTVGIDLGTTYSAVAWINPIGQPAILHNSDGDNITPSAVYFQGGEVIVGRTAKQMAVQDPHNVIQYVKRHMGDPNYLFVTAEGEEYNPEQISGIILKRLIKDASLAMGEPVTDVVITVPAYFDESQRLATKQAGEIAGVNVLQVLNEPTAAAISFGLENDFTGRVLVYDLGGGTFDATLMDISEDNSFDILVTKGDRDLGGFNFDSRIMDWLNEQFVLEGGADFSLNETVLTDVRERAEQAKRALTQASVAKVFLTIDGKTGRYELTRSTFEELTEDLLERTQDLIEVVLEEAETTIEAIDKVLLVGGSTRMPMVAALVERMFGKAPDQTSHPDEAVALGAAVVADIRSADEAGEERLAVGSQDLVIRDVVSHGLGIIATTDSGQDINSVIIPANTTIPVGMSEKYVTSSDRQTELLIQVTEGDESELRYVRIIGSSLLQIPPYAKGAPIDVILHCDIDGILHVQVIDLTSNKHLGEFEIDRKSNLDSETVQTMQLAIGQMDIS